MWALADAVEPALEELMAAVPAQVASGQGEDATIEMTMRAMPARLR